MNILYRYCSTASFHAIAQSQSLWLSALSLSNDTMERKLVASTIVRLAKKDPLQQEFVRYIQDVLGIFEKIIDGLGFCLSEEGDLLSQWRGYAGDATRIAIGFSAEYLDFLSKASMSRDKPGFTLQKVEYEPSSHEARVEPTYNNIGQLIKKGAFSKGIGLLDRVGVTDQELKENVMNIEQAKANLKKELLSFFPYVVLAEVACVSRRMRTSAALASRNRWRGRLFASCSEQSHRPVPQS